MVEQVKTKTEPYVRFRGFDDEWEEVKLGDVGNITTGSTPSTSISDYYSEDNSGLLWVTPTDISESPVIRATSKSLTSKGATKVRLLEPNSLLITCIASIGKNALLLEKGATNQQINALTAYADYDPYFLYTQSEKWTPKLKALAGTGTMEIINKTELSLFFTMTPSLDEQQKIGELFQTLDKAINLSNTQVENMKQQKKALQQRLFPQKGETEPKVRLRGFDDEWEEVTLGDVAKLKNGYSFKSDLYTDNGSYKILTIGNITGDTYIDTTNTKTISKLPENIQEHQILSTGDILISMTGNVGRISMVDVEDTLLNQRVGLIDVGDTVDRTFMYQVLSNPLFEANMVNRGQGAAQMNIGKSDIESYSIYIPSLEEQQAIGELFQTVDEQIRLAEDKVSQYKELKQALLQRLFV